MRSLLIGAVGAGLLMTGAAWGQDMAPQGDANAPANRAIQHNSIRQTTDPAKGSNSFTEGQARSRIAKGGYSHISALRKDDAGLWQGTAHKQGKTVHVALDYKGEISAN